MATSTQLILWLLPGEPARTFFGDTIDRLALQHDAPRFEPHLTLGCTESSELSAIRASSITLPIIGVDTSASFTKTLFVRFQRSAALTQLRQSLGMEACGYDPHLSLLYRHAPDLLRRQLATSLSLPFPTVTFDVVAAIRCPAEVVTPADVEAWETVARKALA